METTGSSPTNYTWDDENPLTKVRFKNGQIETLTYAADGQRRQRVDQFNGTWQFVWDGDNLLLYANSRGACDFPIPPPLSRSSGRSMVA